MPDQFSPKEEVLTLPEVIKPLFTRYDRDTFKNELDDYLKNGASGYSAESWLPDKASRIAHDLSSFEDPNLVGPEPRDLESAFLQYEDLIRDFVERATLYSDNPNPARALNKAGSALYALETLNCLYKFIITEKQKAQSDQGVSKQYEPAEKAVLARIDYLKCEVEYYYEEWEPSSEASEDEQTKKLKLASLKDKVRLEYQKIIEKDAQFRTQSGGDQEQDVDATLPTNIIILKNLSEFEALVNKIHESMPEEYDVSELIEGEDVVRVTGSVKINHKTKKESTEVTYDPGPDNSEAGTLKVHGVANAIIGVYVVLYKQSLIDQGILTEEGKLKSADFKFSFNPSDIKLSRSGAPLSNKQEQRQFMASLDKAFKDAFKECYVSPPQQQEPVDAKMQMWRNKQRAQTPSEGAAEQEEDLAGPRVSSAVG